MNKLILYIFSKTPVGKMLDGKKTVIGAVLVILAASMETLEKLAPLFPEASWVGEAAKSVGDVLKAVEPLVESLGLGFLTAGVLHKGAKAKQQ